MSKNPVLYLVINSDLKMSKGKVLAQICHAISEIFSYSFKNEPTQIPDWKRKGEAKIVLKATFNQMQSIISQIDNYNKENPPIRLIRIHDAGRTQIPAGSLTVLAIGPWEKIIISKFVADLKMY